MRVTMLYLNLGFTFDGIYLQVLYHLLRQDLLTLHLAPPHLQPPQMIYLVCIQYTWGVPIISGLHGA